MWRDDFFSLTCYHVSLKSSMMLWSIYHCIFVTWNCWTKPLVLNACRWLTLAPVLRVLRRGLLEENHPLLSWPHWSLYRPSWSSYWLRTGRTAGVLRVCLTCFCRFRLSFVSLLLGRPLLSGAVNATDVVRAAPVGSVLLHIYYILHDVSVIFRCERMMLCIYASAEFVNFKSETLI